MSDKPACHWSDCRNPDTHICGVCDGWFCNRHFEHGPWGDAPHGTLVRFREGQQALRIAEELAEQVLGDLDGAKSDDVILALCTLFLDVNIVARAEIKADAARILLQEWRNAVELANRQPER